MPSIQSQFAQPPRVGPSGVPIAYCTECEWERRADDGETGDLDRAMIAHYVETGHSPIERADSDLETILDSLEDRAGTGRIEPE